MDNDNLAHDPAGRRPSTRRRIENLRALVAALAEQDMGYLSVAAFLQCSPSAAHQYLRQLSDAGIVSYRRGRRSDCTNTGSYYLDTEPTDAYKLITAIVEPKRAPRLSGISVRPEPARLSAARYVHSMDGELVPLSLSHGTIRRDPLVVALFGEAPFSRHK